MRKRIDRACYTGVATLAALLSTSAAHAAEDSVTALVGGTVIDVSRRGSSAHDIAGAVILLQGARIAAVGSSSTIAAARISFRGAQGRRVGSSCSAKRLARWAKSTRRAAPPAPSTTA